MKTAISYLKDLYTGPFQAALVFSFTLVAAVTFGIGVWVISTTIQNYMVEAMDERIARDIHLAGTFYETKLQQISGIANRLSLHPAVINNLEAACRGEQQALNAIESELFNKSLGLGLGGNHFIAILNTEGQVVAGWLNSTTGEQLPVSSDGNWSQLSIIAKATENGSTMAGTEVIPAELLSQVGLEQQANIALIDTPRAAPQLFDPREGSAGLALVGVAPVLANNEPIGTALVFHVFNNDFTLVDQIKEAAQIDTVTIFFGDLRISTNVLAEDGKRAVGTRVSQDVGDVVLYQGREYVGTAFVVAENFITRYEPLRDHTQKIVGILYVGARQSAFLNLINTVNRRISLVAFMTILLTFLLATPVSRMITRPLKELKELSTTSRRVAGGDHNARAPVTTGGEVGQLAEAFNNMLDILQTTQDQLVQSEKLASLGQLAAGVAHELNNPLSTILLFSDILLNESNPSDQHRADLETVVQETQRCKTIVSSLLDFARQHQIEVQELDLNALIQTIINIEKKREDYASIEIIKELNPDLPKIQADPAQLQAVLTNLMSNSLEAMPQGGKLSIRTHLLQSGNVSIVVEDTGVGIPPENLAKLFTPFFTTKSIGKGTGLGLAIVYGIIKMHHGQINVKSTVGSGTSITIQLPIHAPGTGKAVHKNQNYQESKGLIG